MIRKLVDLPDDEVGWFYETYGSSASLSWCLGLLLKEFKNAHIHTPLDYARLGAIEFRRKVSEGIEHEG